MCGIYLLEKKLWVLQAHKGKELEIQSGSGTLSVTSHYGKTVGWEFVGGRDFLYTELV